MRLFVGVTLDDEVRAQAAVVARELQRRLDPRVRATWISPEKLHLTVRFIGHVEDSLVAAVLQALGAPLPIAPFEVVLSGCGVFPSSGPPRVAWIGLRTGLSSLRAMHDEFDRRLARVGFEPENRPFSAHLTLARFKDVPRELARTTREAVDVVHVPAAQCRVDHATVFQSKLSAKGSAYLPLARVGFEGWAT
jgi:2'-5' RNA ligase